MKLRLQWYVSVLRLSTNTYKIILSPSIRHFIYHHRRRAESTRAAPASVVNSAAALGTIAVCAASLFPLLVDPSFWRSEPLCPFEVASTADGMLAVPWDFVTAVVEYVTVVEGFDSERASSDIKTSANPGAGT